LSIKYQIPAMLLLLGINASTLADDNSQKEPAAEKQVIFYAMGDVPYAADEDKKLVEQVADIPADAEFVVHVGDIKRGLPLCTEAVYQKVSTILRRSSAPVFIIPGDNEWNDCLIPAQAWKYWDQYFMKFDSQWQHGLTVARQTMREENFAFVKGHVLFVGLNIVGGRVHDAEEWQLRHAADLAWTRENLRRSAAGITSLVIFGHARPAKVHDDFFVPLSDTATEFGKPVLYLHGDGHRWTHDRPFKAKNILRIQVDQGGIAPPLKVTITSDPARPFKFDRRNGMPAE